MSARSASRCRPAASERRRRAAWAPLTVGQDQPGVGRPPELAHQRPQLLVLSAQLARNAQQTAMQAVRQWSGRGSQEGEGALGAGVEGVAGALKHLQR